MTPTSDQLKALHDLVAATFMAMEEAPDKPADKNWWEAHRCLKDSLYDLWGAFGAIGLREQDDDHLRAAMHQGEFGMAKEADPAIRLAGEQGTYLELAQERLLLAASEAIVALMTEQGVKRTELARRLGMSKPHVTQLLDGRRNLTLKTLARMAYALGAELHLSVSGLDRR
ncbi:MAG TPA: helix-turn-helix transcriptional regulator [Acidimicrobiales bacterium]